MGFIHVEVVGLPGSGKTTVSKKACKRRRKDTGKTGQTRTRMCMWSYAYPVALCRRISPIQTDLFCRQLFPRFIHPVGQRLPNNLISYIKSGAKTENKDGTDDYSSDFLRLSKQLADKYTEDNNRRTKVVEMIDNRLTECDIMDAELSDDVVVLFDEGFVQRTHSIFCPPKPLQDIERDDLRQYLSAMPEPDFVVFLDVTPELAEKRMQSRKDGYPDSYSHMNTDEILSNLKRTEKCFDTVASILSEMDIQVARIENTETPEGAAEELREKIVAYF